MVDFTLNDMDQKILDELLRQSVVIRKHSRYYDLHEEELPPKEFPEAKEFDHIPQLYKERRKHEGHTGRATFTMLTAHQQGLGDNWLPLRAPKSSLGNFSLTAAGTDEQKKKWGKMVLSMANTEPGAGSDSKEIETTAVLDGEEWVLNGEKIFITHGITSEGIVAWATLDKSAGRGAIKAFLVEKGTPGLELAKKEKKMGIRSSDTAAFVLKDCRIPRENLLGLDETIKTGGGGFKGLMQTFNITRPHVAVMATGMIQACYEFIVDALKKEGVEVDWEAGPQKQGALQEMMIELKSQLEASVLTALRAGWVLDQGKPNELESSVSKAKGGDVCRRGAQIAIEILGALGITHDQLVEKWYRDSRITDIYEGTGEIIRLVVARAILNYSSADLM